MKINFNKLGYRKSTVALILNRNNQILIIQKQSYKDNEWDFPGGGIDGDETASEAILRELREELGSEKFEIKKIDKNLDKYDWPKNYILERFKKHGKTYLGQERTRFLVKFNGEESEIKIEEDEIRKFKWIEIKDLEKYLVFPGYFGRIKKVLEEFGINE
jgi:putative (di)nucleoside polyphosphate hydrolase